MKYTQQSMDVEDWLGRNFVRGLYVCQEVFEADMINRVLVQLVTQKSTKTVQGLIQLWIDQARASSIHAGKLFQFDSKTATALAQCMADANPVAAASLLRVAHMEQVMLEMISDLLPELAVQQAHELVTAHHADELTIVFTVNGEAQEGTERKIFELGAEALLKETASSQWYDGEYLNLPYVIENDLLDVARLIMAKCSAVKALENLYGRIMRSSGNHEGSIEMTDTITAARYTYLNYQKRTTFIKLAGFPDAQHGLSETEANHTLFFKMSKTG